MKQLIVILLSLFFLFAAKETAHAAILVIDESGELNWNVLSESIALEVSETPSIQVKEVADRKTSSNAKVVLKRDGDKVNLISEGDRTLDVTNWSEDLIQIEGRESVKRLEIGLHEDKFSIKQGDITVFTSFPINIDPKENKISLTTDSGEKYLAILPYDAAQSVLRSRVLSKVIGDGFEIIEEEKDLSYKIEGEKVINLFNVYDLSIPVTAKISASTGEILLVDPPWLSIINYLLV